MLKGFLKFSKIFVHKTHTRSLAQPIRNQKRRKGNKHNKISNSVKYEFYRKSHDIFYEFESFRKENAWMIRQSLQTKYIKIFRPFLKFIKDLRIGLTIFPPMNPRIFPRELHRRPQRQRPATLLRQFSS